MARPERKMTMGIGNNNTVPRTWTARPDRRPLRALPQTRRYDVAYIARNSEVIEFNRIAPAMSVFEDAFCAMARGTIIATEDGPVAVEDLQPGTQVCTRDNGPQTLLWVGSMTVVPGARKQSEGMGNLSRITADGFGLGRPMPDLVLGPRARLLRRDTGLVSAMGTSAALVPITAFTDGDTVLEITPVAPVRVYHLAFASHQIICANGLEIESYHPGKRDEILLSGELQALFLAFFPHISALNDFGPLAYPRMSRDDAMGILTA